MKRDPALTRHNTVKPLESLEPLKPLKPLEPLEPPELPEPLDGMIALVNQFITGNERLQTAIPFLSLMRASHPTPISRGVLKPSCCMILQGHKRVLLGQDVFDYGPGEFLAVTLDLPAAGQIVNATPQKPYLLLNLEFDPQELAAIVIEAQLDVSPPGVKAGLAPELQPVRAAFVGQSDAPLRDALYQLLRLLQQPAQEAAFLAVGLKREIIYRLLRGPHGPQLYRNLVLDQHDRGIGKAIAWLNDHYDQPIKVEQLAQATNMSVSSLHHRFKAVTTMGPLQYQKQLRLQRARLLLLGGGIDAGTAAFRVGYESASQFSREYRRLFGAPPMQDIRSALGA